MNDTGSGSSTTPRKKVLYVEGSPYVNYPADPRQNVGGSLISVSYLINDLNKHRFDPSLYLFYDSYLVDRIQIQRHNIFIKTKEHRAGKSKKPVHVLFSRDKYLFLSFLKRTLLRMAPSVKRLYSFLKEAQPDIVHCNNSLKWNLDAILASRLVGIPCVCHIRGYEDLNLIHKMFARFARYYICISEAVKNNYLEQGIHEEKLLVIPNGLNIQDFPKPVRQDHSGDDFVITTIGRMVDWKGHDVFMESIPRIVQEQKNIQFWFVGDGEKRAELEKRAADLDVGRYTRFKGIAPDIRPVLSDSDLVVHVPTKPEPFGRVVIEAMSMQKPVISTNLGGPSEIITHGRDGILIEPNEPDQLADTILELIENEDLRQRLGDAARKTIEERFDNQRVVQDVEGIYETIFK